MTKNPEHSRFFRRLTAAAMLAMTAGTGAQAACLALGNGGVVTVAGAITKTNRPAFAEEADRFHAYRGNKFDRAFAFSIDALAALPQQSIDAFVPYNQKISHFDGPALSDVLKAVGVDSFKAVTLQAIDGYEIRMEPADVAKQQPILALCRDGVPLDIGGLGPVYVAIPLPPGQTVAPESVTNLQVWGLMLLGVE